MVSAPKVSRRREARARKICARASKGGRIRDEAEHPFCDGCPVNRLWRPTDGGDRAMTWTHYLPALLKGAEVTAIIAVASMLLGAAFAFAAGLARFSGGRLLSCIAVIYIEIFRGTSLLVQLFWLYYALPLIGISFDPITTGVVGLALNIGAYGAEVVRGALKSVPDTQHEAARALNFGRGQALFHIVLPQAVVEMMPPFGNLAVQNLKDTALVSLISISDLT